MNNYGYFSEGPVIRLLSEGGEDRKIEILEEFSYTDQRDKVWTAHSGDKVDGASIPRILWSIVGPPLVGNYRRASIIHDVECERKIHPFHRVHEMFYHACRAGGVGAVKAGIMYGGVMLGGPKWEFFIIGKTDRGEGVTSPDPGLILRGSIDHDYNIQNRYSVPIENDLTPEQQELYMSQIIKTVEEKGENSNFGEIDHLIADIIPGLK